MRQKMKMQAAAKSRAKLDFGQSGKKMQKNALDLDDDSPLAFRKPQRGNLFGNNEVIDLLSDSDEDIQP